MSLVFLVGVWKTGATPGPPSAWDAIARRSRLSLPEKAVGGDLLVAAVGSYFAFFIARHAGSQAEFELDRADLLIFPLAGFIAVVMVLVNKVGHERHSEPPALKEDWGVTVPNVLGFLAMMVIFIAN